MCDIWSAGMVKSWGVSDAVPFAEKEVMLVPLPSELHPPATIKAASAAALKVSACRCLTFMANSSFQLLREAARPRADMTRASAGTGAGQPDSSSPRPDNRADLPRRGDRRIH